MWRKACWGLLLLVTILAATPCLASDASPRLFFEKSIAIGPEKTPYTHKVREGEWLYEILRSYGFTDDDIPSLLEAISRLNPNIRDLNNLEPGQTIVIPPVKPIPPPDQSIPRSREEFLKYIEKSYTVRSGDTPAKIIRDTAGVTDALVFNEFLDLFHQLNPQLPPSENLASGQVVKIPVPVSNATGSPARPPSIRTSNQTLQPPEDRDVDTVRAPPTPEPPARGPQPFAPPDEATNATFNRAYSLAMLEKAGFNFVKGTETLHPLADGTWFRINLRQTPLAMTRWGQKVLLVPAQSRRPEFASALSGDMVVCDLPEAWRPDEVFVRLEKATGNKISRWPSDRPLILQRDGFTIELLGDHAVLVDSQSGGSVHLFNLLRPEVPPVPSLLRGFLDRMSVHVSEWRRVNNRLEDIRVRWPAMSALLTPVIPAHNAWPEIQDLLGAKSADITPAARNIVTVMSELQAAGLAVPRNTRFTFPLDARRSIVIIAPVMELATDNGTAYIFDSRHADPYLLALLTLQGKRCFAVSERLP